MTGTPIKMFAFGNGFYAGYYGNDEYDQLTKEQYDAFKKQRVPAEAAVPNAKV